MRKLFLLPHTHWDREWYLPFEAFRSQLLAVVRQVLDRLDHGELPFFYLDGQSVIFEDLLEIDPSLAPRLSRHMQDGRLLSGPWYVLGDQMLVSGESLIRNLKLGIALTVQFGKPCPVGYCPDTFGHSQDLPRILAGFGIESALVWRGVPYLEMGPLFWWLSPDGSRVLTYHLSRGYYQSAIHEMEDSEGGIAAAADWLAGWVGLGGDKKELPASYYPTIEGALVPCGGDHIGSPPNLNRTIKQINKHFEETGVDALVIPSKLDEFVADVRAAASSKLTVVSRIEGELLSNVAAEFWERAYLLYGVLSSRLYLKQANRLAQQRLSDHLEPAFTMLSLFLGFDYPEKELERAWKLLLKNHPHDSICGCSIDSVHKEMMSRFAGVMSLLTSLENKAILFCAGGGQESLISPFDPDFGADRLSILNFSGQTSQGPFYHKWMELPGSKELEQSDRLQIISRRPCDQLFSGWGTVPYYKDVEIVEGFVFPDPIPPFSARSLRWPLLADSKQARSQIKGGLEASADDIRSSRAATGKSLPASIPSDKDSFYNLAQVTERKVLSNGLLTLSVEGDGTVAVESRLPGQKARLFRLGHILADVGDGGDTYNFDPLPDDQPITAILIVFALEAFMWIWKRTVRPRKVCAFTPSIT